MTQSVLPCPVCESNKPYLFYEQFRVPCQDGYIWPTRQSAIDAPTGDLRMHYCPDCSHIFNSAFDPSKFVFDDSYNISLHHSPTYQKFITELTDQLVQQLHLRGKTILEIGCGKADFLKGITLPFGNRGIGFDPTFVDENLTEDQRKSITVHKRFYTAADQSVVADFVTFRSMLQYITAPREFVQNCRQSVARPHGVLYAEVPNGDHTFDQLCIWNLVYEHGCFYNRHSLATLFATTGYEVQNVFTCFVENQNLGIEAGVAPSSRQHAIDQSAIAQYEKTIDRFVTEHAKKVQEWRSILDHLLGGKKRVALWGAGARAISFCNLFNMTDAQLPYVVDINPHRQGRFLPLTLQKVVAPQHLLVDRPEVIIITNSGYAHEIRAQIATMGLKCETFVL